MRPEDELDARLSESTQAQRASRELAPLLAAAARLAPLRDAAPDRAFADDLEERLLARLGQRPSTASAPPRRPPRIPSRVAWATIAATLFITIGLGALTAKAAPGAPLYGVRQFAQTLAAQAAGSAASDPYAALSRARSDLTAYDAASASRNTGAALAALARLRADDRSAAQAAASLGDANARQQAQAQIAAFRQLASNDLRASLAWLGWQPRAQVTDALRAWGDAALMVAQITVRSAGSGNHSAPAASASSLLVEAHGTGFAAGARLLVNGAPNGTTVSLSPTQAVFQVAASALDLRQENGPALAIENPDGTVAVAHETQRDDRGGPGEVGTPGAGDQNGDHSEPTTTPNAESTTSPHPTTTPDGSSVSDGSGGSSSLSGH